MGLACVTGTTQLGPRLLELRLPPPLGQLRSARTHFLPVERRKLLVSPRLALTELLRQRSDAVGLTGLSSTTQLGPHRVRLRILCSRWVPELRKPFGTP